jgi:hypothetical protein
VIFWVITPDVDLDLLDLTPVFDRDLLGLTPVFDRDLLGCDVRCRSRSSGLWHRISTVIFWVVTPDGDR